MALAESYITALIDKIIAALKTAAIEGIAGVYFGDQEAYSAYPVICVGAPPLLNENFPVMAGETVRDEIYNIPILLYVNPSIFELFPSTNHSTGSELGNSIE